MLLLWSVAMRECCGHARHECTCVQTTLVHGLTTTAMHENEYPPPFMQVYIYIYIGWVGVGWRRRCKTRLSLRGLENQGTVFSVCFGGYHGWRSS